MKEREFDEWWKAHRAAFLSIDQWLGKMPTDGERRAGRSDRLKRSEIPDTELTQGDVLRAWRACLADVPLKEALAVSASMSRGDIDPPKTWDDHPRTVRKHAKGSSFQAHKTRGRLVDGEWTYKCQHCQDEGFRNAWHPAIVDRARREPEAFMEHGPWHQAPLACTCAAGEGVVQRYAKRKPPWSIPVFDESQHYDFVNGLAGRQKLLDELQAEGVGTEWTGADHTYPGAF